MSTGAARSQGKRESRTSSLPKSSRPQRTRASLTVAGPGAGETSALWGLLKGRRHEYVAGRWYSAASQHWAIAFMAAPPSAVARDGRRGERGPRWSGGAP